MKRPFWIVVRHAPFRACRRADVLHRRIEHRDLAGRAQAPRKLHVFHERDLRKALHAQEDFAPHEDRLIAVKRAAVLA